MLSIFKIWLPFMLLCICLLTSCSGDDKELSPPGKVSPELVEDISSETYWGSLRGVGNVRDSGAFKYSIPIDVPPGIAGMTPELTVQYSSNSSNGLLGKGWAVSGFSTIHRCSKSIVQDGLVERVKFNSQDQYCLDGERLILISGVHGEEGAEYRTEIDDHSRIYSYDSSQEGAGWFKIITKQGEIYEYGNTTLSKVDIEAGGPVSRWLINKIEDTVGNYLNFIYYNNVSTGEFYPTRIDYTGHEGRNISPSNSVRFFYDLDRNDKKVGYTQGRPNTTSVLLSSIKTYAGNDLVKEFLFGYHNLALGGDSRLEFMRECDAFSNCRQDIEFSWLQDSSPKNFSFASYSFTDSHSYTWRSSLGDFNGDGRMDILWDAYSSDEENKDPNVKVLSLSNGDGTFSDFPLSLRATNKKRIAPNNVDCGVSRWRWTPYVGDFNGDGTSDIYWDHTSDYGHSVSDSMVYFSKGDGTFDSVDVLPNNVSFDDIPCTRSFGVRPIFGDFNGDGLLDRLLDYSSSEGDHLAQPARYGAGDGTFLEQETESNATSGGVQTPADLNGDGLTDLIVQDKYYAPLNGVGVWTGKYNIYINEGSGKWRKSDELQLHLGINDFYPLVGDYNGDGIQDIIFYSKRDLNCKLWIGRGEGTYIKKDVELPVREPVETVRLVDHAKTGDFNGDGNTDIFWGRDLPEGGERTLWLGKSDASGFEEVVDLGVLNNLYADDYLLNRVRHDLHVREQYLEPIVADFTGDGLPDISFKKVFSESDGSSDLVHKRNAHFWVNKYKNSNLMSGIVDSNRNETKVQYGTLNNESVYAASSGASFPFQDVKGSARYVVSSLWLPDGLGDEDGFRYRYTGLVRHAQGLGSLGYKKHLKIHDKTGISTEVTYSQSYPYIGLTLNTQTRYGEVLLTEIKEKYEYSNSHQTSTNIDVAGEVISTPVSPYLSSRVTTSNLMNADVSEVVDSKVQSDRFTYDFFGNVLFIDSIVTGDGHSYSTHTINTYGPRDVDRYMGRLASKVEKKLIDDIEDSSTTHTSLYTYDLETFMLLTQVREPDSIAPLKMITSYTYDDFGNKLSSTLSASDEEPRIQTWVYDSEGQFVITATDGEEHSTHTVYEPKFGGLTEITDANGNKVCYQYDSFGRKVSEDSYCGTPNEIRVTTEYKMVSSSSLDDSLFAITSHTKNASDDELVAPSRLYFDSIERKIRSLDFSFDGKAIFTDTQYDSLKRKIRVSKPYLSDSSNIYWTTYQYDQIARVNQISLPSGDLDGDGSEDGSYSETVTYSGFEKIKFDGENRGRSETTSALGEVVKVVEDVNGLAVETEYRYDSRSNLIEVEDDQGNQIIVEYDLLGRKSSISDPSMGVFYYLYNSFGELILQTDNLSQRVSMTYDKLGRIVSRSELEGTSTWKYDSAEGAGIGMLANESGPNGTQKSFVYNSRGNLISEYVDMGATIGGDESFYVDKSYDELGRITSIGYPTVENESFNINYHYNSIGYLSYISDQYGEIYWLLGSVNTKGQLLSDTYRNGVKNTAVINGANGFLISNNSVTSSNQIIQEQNYSYNRVGGLTKREMNYQSLSLEGFLYGTIESLSETFSYDDLDRVTGADLYNSHTNYTHSEVYTYDSIGNIKSKTGVGSYEYGGECSGVSAGPHAVTKVGTLSYCYDENGNMTSGAGKTISYTSYNKPSELKGLNGSAKFYYGANRSRLMKRSSQNGVESTTYYVGLGVKGAPVYEKVVNEDGSSDHLFFIYAGGLHSGHAFAQRRVHENSDSSTQESHQYYHRDHLGSVSAISDESGELSDSNGLALVQILSFDVWGKQRHPDGSGGLEGGLASHGNLNYTGQEQIPELQLIHMNGRVYDPAIGRMLSADSTVPDAGSAVGFNRYAYVFNNPLRYVDPTGYEPVDTPDMEEVVVEGFQGGEPEYTADSVLLLFIGGSELYFLTVQELVDIAAVSKVSKGELVKATKGVHKSKKLVDGVRRVVGSRKIEIPAQKGDVQVRATHLSERKARLGMGMTVTEAEVNLAKASQLVDEYLINNPDAMPEGLVRGLTFEYVHEIHPTAGAVQRMLPNPALGLSVTLGAVKMYAGSVNNVRDGVLTILHEYGHHSTAAISARRGRVYQTPRAERASDSYGRRVYNEVF